MRREISSLFLTLLILISLGGAVSIVGAASHVTPAQVTKSTFKADSCPFVGNPHTCLLLCELFYLEEGNELRSWSVL